MVFLARNSIVTIKLQIERKGEKRKNFFEKFYFETFQFVLNVQIAQHGVVNHLLGKQKTC